MGMYSIAGVAGKTAEMVNTVANGDATIKDYQNKEVAKFKNYLKTSTKWAAAGAVACGVMYPAAKCMADESATTNLPKFAKTLLNKKPVQKLVGRLSESSQKFLNKESVKDFASKASGCIEEVGTGLINAAKKHPLAALAITGTVAALGAVHLKFMYDCGKADGKAEQKFDDIVKANRELKKDNPISD